MLGGAPSLVVSWIGQAQGTASYGMCPLTSAVVEEIGIEVSRASVRQINARREKKSRDARLIRPNEALTIYLIANGS
jgi:hypothetical protein